MTKRCWREWFVVVIVFLAACTRAIGDDSNLGQPLIQAQFDKLIPTSYPTATSRFDRLRETTWPLIDPGVATIPITDNLVHPLEQPLLITSEGVGQFPRIKSIQETVKVVRRGSEVQPHRTGGKGH
ncbi:MAG TPA: hypothetical protein VGI60_14660 [Chthoniobacterales bacterium]|jgi:hypothetical protein